MREDDFKEIAGLTGALLRNEVDLAGGYSRNDMKKAVEPRTTHGKVEG
jgi:hypothetical protein